MIGTIIGLIFLCIILGVIWWGAQQLIALIPLGEPFATIVRILMIVILVIIIIYILIVLLGLAGIHVSMPKL
jgi:heme/copper-type cytochrome/quinol oxidase subunit 2